MTIFALMLGCAFEEDLPEKDIPGKVILPAAALTRMTVGDPEGDGTLTEPVEVTDPRLIGPVYLGAFSGIDNESFTYPHPAMGPIIEADTPGDAFPYGGTTVGRFDFGCYESLTCRVVTGRYEDYESVLDWFANYLGRPVQDNNANIVDYPSTYQQACYDYLEVTSDDEVSFIGAQHFTLNDDGDYEADFYIPHADYVDGMSVWGWMDAPQISTSNPDINGTFSTCRTDGGREYEEYTDQYTEGFPYYDLLNSPSLYIGDGDWVSAGTEIGALDEDGNVSSVTVRIDIEVGGEE